MTFSGQNTQSIYQEILEREQFTGRLAGVDFDLEDYVILKKQAGLIVKNQLSDSEAATLVLSFAFAMLRHVRRERGWDDRSFWREFENQLDLNPNVWGQPAYDQNFVRYSLFAPALQAHRISLHRSDSGSTRLFVLTIRQEFESGRQEAAVKRRQVEEFFLWYFNHENGTQITPELIRCYQSQNRRIFSFPERALPSLNDNCRKLTRIVELAIEHGFFLQTDFGPSEHRVIAHEWNAYRQRITQVLGIDHDPASVRLAGDAHTLQRIILLLQNHRTPTQFLSEMHRALSIHPLGHVTTPQNMRFGLRAAVERWRPEEMAFGLYRLSIGRVDTVDYRVVPAQWLRLEEMALWPTNKMVTPRQGWIGYIKKTGSFEVRIGSSSQTRDHRAHAFVIGGSNYFLWAGEIVPGRRIVLDGKPCPQSQGAYWESPTLRSTLDDTGEARLSLVIPQLEAYLPQHPNGQILVRTSQSQEQQAYLDHEGCCDLRRALVLHLEEFSQPVEVSASIADETFATCTIPTREAMLFSGQTQEELRPGTLTHEGRRFRFFCSPAVEPEFDTQVLEVEECTLFGSLRVFNIVWADRQRPFELRAGSFQWRIERQSYFDFWMQPQLSPTPVLGQAVVKLDSHQRHAIEANTFRIETSDDLQERGVRCAVFDSGGAKQHDESTTTALRQLAPGRYQLSPAFCRRLNDMAHGKQWFTLRFYELRPETLFERTLASMSLALVPQVTLEMEPLAEEDAPFELSIHPLHGAVRDAVTGQAVARTKFTRWPQVQDQPWLAETHARGITCPLSGLVEVAAELLTVHGEEQGITIRARPFLFGLRLFSRTLLPGQCGSHLMARGPYWKVNALDFYDLESSALAFSTSPLAHTTVEGPGGRCLWRGQANEQGHGIWENLRTLYDEALRIGLSRITFTLCSKGSRRDFGVVWAPRVQGLEIVDEGEVRMVRLVHLGPRDASVLLQIGDAAGVVQSQQTIACRGTEAKILCAVPESVLHGGGFAQALLSSPSAGPNSPLVPAHREAIAAPTVASTIPGQLVVDKPLAQGIGFSDADLLAALTRSRT